MWFYFFMDKTAFTASFASFFCVKKMAQFRMGGFFFSERWYRSILERRYRIAIQIRKRDVARESWD